MSVNFGNIFLNATSKKPSISIEEIEARRNEELKKLENTENELVENDVQIQELQNQIEELNKEKENIEYKIAQIEEIIEDLSQEASQTIAEALKNQDKITKEHQEKCKEAIDKQIKQYVADSKIAAAKGEEAPSKSKLSSDIQNAMPEINLGSVLYDLIEANEQIAQIDDHLFALNGYILDYEAVNMDLSVANSTVSEISSAANNIPANTDEIGNRGGCCDPIGFVVENEDGQQIQYDFVVDKDNDNKLNNTNEFLGAQNQWAEMEAIDGINGTQKDGIITADELEAAGVSVVANKSNDLNDISDTLGEDFSIDLNSYQQGGTHSAIDTISDSDNDGVANQSLLGVFNVNIDGKTVQGYNTLDDVDYLNQEYNITSRHPRRSERAAGGALWMA